MSEILTDQILGFFDYCESHYVIKSGVLGRTISASLAARIGEESVAKIANMEPGDMLLDLGMYDPFTKFAFVCSLSYTEEGLYAAELHNSDRKYYPNNNLAKVKYGTLYRMGLPIEEYFILDATTQDIIHSYKFESPEMLMDHAELQLKYAHGVMEGRIEPTLYAFKCGYCKFKDKCPSRVKQDPKLDILFGEKVY